MGDSGSSGVSAGSDSPPYTGRILASVCECVCHSARACVRACVRARVYHGARRFQQLLRRARGRIPGKDPSMRVTNTCCVIVTHARAAYKGRIPAWQRRFQPQDGGDDISQLYNLYSGFNHATAPPAQRATIHHPPGPPPPPPPPPPRHVSAIQNTAAGQRFEGKPRPRPAAAAAVAIGNAGAAGPTQGRAAPVDASGNGGGWGCCWW